MQTRMSIAYTAYHFYFCDVKLKQLCNVKKKQWTFQDSVLTSNGDNIERNGDNIV